MRYTRKLIRIDEDLCTGCGQCVPGCAEGALQIIDGKARLVSERYCDGLGACLGHCPTGALTVVEVPAEDFDPRAVTTHLQAQGRAVPEHMPNPEELRLPPSPSSRPSGGCPGARLMSMTPCQAANTPTSRPSAHSALTHWPVQIRLVPPQAPFLNNADLLVTADCAPVAYPDFHADFLKGRVLLLGCPKFDDAQAYIDRFQAIFSTQPVNSVTVLEMEVPCCSGLSRIVLEGLARARKHVPVEKIVISRDGRVLSREHLSRAAAALQPLSA